MRMGRPTFDSFCFIGSTPRAWQIVERKSGTVHRPLRHDAAVLAGLADDLAALDSAAGQDGAPAVGEVIAALLRVDLRRAAELAHPDDERRIEQAAFF